MATKNSNKQLTLGKLQAVTAKKYTQRKLIIDIDGTNHEILVDEHVDPIKLDFFAEELIEKSAYIKSKEYPISDEKYANFLVCKYFTNMEICNTASDYSIQIQILYEFMRRNILDKIVSIVPENEIAELMPQAFNNAIKKISSIEMKKQIEDNPSLLTNILGDKNKDLITLLEKTKELNELKDK